MIKALAILLTSAVSGGVFRRWFGGYPKLGVPRAGKLAVCAAFNLLAMTGVALAYGCSYTTGTLLLAVVALMTAMWAPSHGEIWHDIKKMSVRYGQFTVPAGVAISLTNTVPPWVALLLALVGPIIAFTYWVANNDSVIQWFNSKGFNQGDAIDGTLAVAEYLSGAVSFGIMAFVGIFAWLN